MSKDTISTIKLNNKYTQVEIKNKNQENKKVFIVPNNKVDSFIPAYKKNNRNNSIITNTSFATTILSAILLTGLATKKIIKNNTIKFITNTLAGIIAGTATFIGIEKFLETREKNLLKTFHTQDISKNFKS